MQTFYSAGPIDTDGVTAIALAAGTRPTSLRISCAGANAFVSPDGGTTWLFAFRNVPGATKNPTTDFEGLPVTGDVKVKAVTGTLSSIQITVW